MKFFYIQKQIQFSIKFAYFLIYNYCTSKTESRFLNEARKKCMCL